jgi:hypothetical protein
VRFYPDQRGFDVWEWAEKQVVYLWGSLVPLDYVLDHSELRRELCADDPLLFAWVYLRRHITDKGDGSISFAQPHLEWCELAREWIGQGVVDIAAWRHAFIAPRETGKTTWWFLCIPMWGLAYGHVSFIAAFANATGQAEQHLSTFKRELDTNDDLRTDFPELCTPARRPTGAQVADRQGMLHSRNGAVFAAKGVDSASLGMKVEDRRPDVLIIDDLEPEEAKYSEALAEKRLGTLRDGILPLNIRARVIIVGTVTMPNSITHQLVKSAQGLQEPELEWVHEDKIVTHHQLPLIDLDDGSVVSAWPQKWPTEWLLERCTTREYKKNYENDPMARDGDYWTLDDFVYGELANPTHALLSIDPAVKAKKKSDYTALVVVAYSSVVQKAMIRYARAVKVPPGEQLRTLVLQILEMFPEITGVLIETNNGGDTFLAILHDLPVKVHTVHSEAPKEVRAADLLIHYQRGRMLHERKFPALEGQQVSFPKGANDDLVDAAGAGAAVFLGKFLRQRKKAGVRAAAYV